MMRITGSGGSDFVSKFNKRFVNLLTAYKTSKISLVHNSKQIYRRVKYYGTRSMLDYLISW
jgi:hypothetical protein